MEGAGADFDIQRLDQHAALGSPILIEGLDQTLEGYRWIRRSGHRVIVHCGKAG
jgi:hypothetical protein